MPPTSGKNLDNAVTETKARVNYHDLLQQQRTTNRPSNSRPQSATQSMMNNSNANKGNNGKDVNNPTGNATTSTNNNNNNEVTGTTEQPTPMFERLVTDEVQELKAYARIVEGQNRRLSELERVHGDLEKRLQIESIARQHLEETLEVREREWSNKLYHMELERNKWKKQVTDEQNKNKKLIDQVARKDLDIHKMLQKKYDQGGVAVTRSVRNVRQVTSERGDNNRPGVAQHTSKSPEIIRGNNAEGMGPHRILAKTGSAQEVRIRNTQSLLENFFGDI